MAVKGPSSDESETQDVDGWRDESVAIEKKVERSLDGIKGSPRWDEYSPTEERSKGKSARVQTTREEKLQCHNFLVGS